MTCTSWGTVIVLEKGTVVSLDDVGFWDDVDRIHVIGKSQTLYVDNHFFRNAISYDETVPTESVAPGGAVEGGVTYTPHVVTAEEIAQTEKDRKAAAVRAKEDAIQHLKNVKAAKEFKDGE
jgi:hypothetical protein